MICPHQMASYGGYHSPRNGYSGHCEKIKFVCITVFSFKISMKMHVTESFSLKRKIMHQSMFILETAASVEHLMPKMSD